MPKKANMHEEDTGVQIHVDTSLAYWVISQALAIIDLSNAVKHDTEQVKHITNTRLNTSYFLAIWSAQHDKRSLI